MVTIIQPAGFAIGVAATSIAVATIEPRRAFGIVSHHNGFMPMPAREQLLVRTISQPKRRAA